MISRQHAPKADGIACEKIVLEFRQNAHLPALAGGHNAHLVRLERKFGVKIAMRGNLIAIEGANPGRVHAAEVLRALYVRLEAGEEIGPADIDAKIRFVQGAGRSGEGVGAMSIKTWGNRITRVRSEAQAAYLDLMRNHELVFGIGPAGTGKTYLAAAYGAHLLYERRVDRLILSRPALEAGEKLGFLPGDLREKIDPYLRPLYDALFEVIGEQCNKMMESGVIEVAPLAFMRGRTLSRAFIILDEAQNCSQAQMKMFLTRLGEDSRMVVTGDLSQSDLPAGSSGLAEAAEFLRGVEGVGVAEFTERDVVRHALVTRIVAAYGAHERKTLKDRKGAPSVRGKRE